MKRARHKRYWVTFDDHASNIYRTRRITAPSVKLAVQFMKAIYGDSVNIRSISIGG